MFDTLRFARTSRDRGHFSPEQADAMVKAMQDALDDHGAVRKPRSRELNGPAWIVFAFHVQFVVITIGCFIIFHSHLR